MSLDLEHDQTTVGCPAWAIAPVSRESDHRAITGRINGRSGDDRSASHLLHDQRTSYTTEIVAIEQISLAVLAERKYQVRDAGVILHVYRHRTRTADILIVVV